MKSLKYISVVLFVLMGLLPYELIAQVGINSSTINSSSSAMLDVFSTDKGLLVPRLTTVQRNLIPTPATGLLIYNTTTNRFNYFNGTLWFQIETSYVTDITGSLKAGGGVAVSSVPNVSADSSAMLDVSDFTRGLLVPRTVPGLISAPENGLIIYDQSANLLKYYFDNEWMAVCGITADQQGNTGSQAAIGTAINKTGAPAHHSAILDVSAPDKGILIPRLTAEQRNAVFPVIGLTIFNTTSKSIEFFNGLNWVKMNIYLPASVSITAGQTTVCSGSSVLFTAIPVNGGDTPAYQWKLNGSAVSGATGSTYVYAPQNLDKITCTMTSGLVCVTGSPATSNEITMTVNPLIPVSITIVPSANPVCVGTSVTFTSTIVNGGSLPLYQWKVNGTNVPGATNSTYSYIPAHNDVVTCELTSNVLCPTVNPAVSNQVFLTVNPLLPVSISITPSVNPVCSGFSVTFSSNIVNGGNTPAYQWKKNGTNVSGATQSTYTYVPVVSETVTCVLTSNAACATGSPATSNSVVITITNNPTAIVTIAASANPVCAGSSVTYTATPVSGAGTTPAYQWKVNGVNQGTNSTTFSYVPVHNDVVTCIMTSSRPCVTGSPATSNAITMTVNPLLPVSITVSPSANPVCAGTQVTFSSAIVNGGINPLYQWKKNGTNVTGATNSTFTYNPLHADAVSCVLTSNATCPTGNPATSNTVTMTVNPLLPVGITVTPSANPVCAGTSVTYTSAIVNGGTTPLYQWKKNGSNVSGATNSSYTFVPVHNDAISCVLTSNAVCPTGNPATSNVSTMTVNPLLPVSLTISPSVNPVCAGFSVTFSSSAVNAGTAPAYQWKRNGTNVSGETNSTYTYVPVVSETITCVLTSNAICATGNPATSNSVVMTITPNPTAVVTIAASANPVCAGTSVTYTATPVAGAGATPSYQWKVNGINQGTNSTSFSYVPLNNDLVTCIMTSSRPCVTGSPATSNTITMTVNPLLPVSITITPSENNVCAGTTVSYSSAIVNGGTTPLYQWRVNGNNISGATNTSYSYNPLHNDVVTCRLTSNATCATGSPATSNGVTMVVNPLKPVTITIQPDANDVCAGTSVTFSAAIGNGGTSPQYQWKLDGAGIAGATNNTYTYIPLNNEVISCVLTSNEICATGNPAKSNNVTMDVNPLLPVSITIAPSADPVCAGTQVTFSSSVINQGPAPQYQWRVNGNAVAGATNASYTYAPLHNDAISCILTSNAICPTGNPATSNTYTMTVNPLLPVSITVAPSANPVCAGTSVTYTSAIVNGGTTPLYQWRLNGNNISGATNASYTYVPLHNDAISCVLTSNAICPTGNPATSNTFVMTVNPLLPVHIQVTPSADPVCAGTSVTFNTTTVNGGTVPLFQWKLNGNDINGATNAAYTYVPLHNDAISCVLTSNAICPIGNPATSNSYTMTVNPLLPVHILISPSADTVCAGTQVTFSSSTVNGGVAPQYQWKLNGNNISGATNVTYTYVPLHNDAISCVLTSNAICPIGNPATSNTYTMTVNPLLPVHITIAPSGNPVCAGTSVTYTSSIVNGGVAPLYQWKLNGNDISGATNVSYTYIPVHNDVISCVLTSNAICPIGNPATSNAVTMTVHPLLPVSITVAPSANPVCAGTSVTFSSTVVNGGAGPLYQWKLNGIDVSGETNSTYTIVPVNDDAISCVVTSNAICPIGNPATSNTVNMTVHPLLPVSIMIASSANPVCAGTSVTFTPTVVNGGVTPLYQWKLNGNNVSGATNVTYTFVPVDNDAISCIVTSNAICPIGNPATSNTVNMTVNPLEPVSITISESANTICAGTSVTYTSSIVNGGSTPQYQWLVNGVSISGATDSTFAYIPLHNDIVKCMVTSNATCPTGNPATSNPITMVVNPLLPVSITIAPSANPICPATSVTFTSAIVNGGSGPLYQWKINGMDVTGATASTYTYAVSNNDLITCKLTSNATCAINTPAMSNTVTMSVNPVAPVSVTIVASTIVSGQPVTFTATPTNGGSSPVYQWKVNNINVGSGGSTYTYTPVVNDNITNVLTSTVSCSIGSPATSNTIKIKDTPLRAVSVTITPSANPICAGSTVNFTSAAVNGGTSPAYQWKNNGTNITGATNATYSYVPTNLQTITCVMTPSGGDAITSNAIKMSVTPLVPVSVSIFATSNAVFPGTPVTYTAVVVNQGTSPSYQWKVNGVVVGTNSPVYTYTPVDHDKVTCTLTSNYTATCLSGNPATSNTITMVVYTTGSPCAGIPTVTYGGEVYNTIQVGTQCWLRENLNVGIRVDGTVTQTNNTPSNIIEKYCYGNLETNCETYGGLYQWAEMVQYLNGATNTTSWNPVPSGNVQGICPTGWHIPTNAEWGALMTYAGGQSVTGGKIKEATTAHFAFPNTGATNVYGFTALPGGVRWHTGLFYYITNDCNLWTVTAGTAAATDCYYGGAGYGITAATNGQFPKTEGLSVRCLKD